jgi:hypothetical protein
MSRVTIELPTGTEQKLREKASLHGKSLEFYLQELLQRDALGANGAALPLAQGELSLEELDRLLDELSQTPAVLPSLPADFSRKDIYAEHD